MSTEPVVQISAIEHFSYCPRQCALIHCDCIWNDNAHTVNGVRAHRRADSGEHRHERGKRVLRSIPLWSETLGLSGRADVVEMKDGEVCPVEYKSGTRHGNAADLQVCAQAMCLEEMLDVSIRHGFVWYGGPRRRDRVDLTPALRSEVQHIILDIREQMLIGKLPPAPDDERCNECQFQEHCLPSLVSNVRRVNRYIAQAVYSCAI